MLETSFLTRKKNTQNVHLLGVAVKFHEGKRNHLQTDLSLVCRTDSSLVDYCDLGDKLGHPVHSPPAWAWILLCGEHKVWFSPQRLPAPRLLRRRLLGLLASPLGARELEQRCCHATLCWPSPPVVPGVCLSPVACWLLLLLLVTQHGMLTTLFHPPSHSSFQLILILPGLIFLHKTVLMSLEHQMVFSVITFTAFIAFLNRMHVQAQVLEISQCP